MAWWPGMWRPSSQESMVHPSPGTSFSWWVLMLLFYRLTPGSMLVINVPIRWWYWLYLQTLRNLSGVLQSGFTSNLSTYGCQRSMINESQSLYANLGRTVLSNYCFEFYTFKWETPVWFLLFLFPRKHFTMSLFILKFFNTIILSSCVGRGEESEGFR